MRIVFMGTPDFAVSSLRILLDNGYAVAAVVTAPDKPRGRGQQITFTPVKDAALHASLPILQPNDLRDPAFAATIADLAPDLIVVVAFRILPREVYAIPRLGSFNLHASLLPKYRGAAPIQWAIINGEKETGVTTFMLQDTVDTGSVILQARVVIGPEETAGELHDKLAEVGAEIVLQTVRLIGSGKAKSRQQDDRQASPAPKLFKEDGRIDWTQPALDVHNRIRGLSPVPGAWTTADTAVLKIFRSQIGAATSSNALPGTIVSVDRTSCEVQTGSGTIALQEVMLEGRKRLGIEEFLRGHRLVVGKRFG